MEKLLIMAGATAYLIVSTLVMVQAYPSNWKDHQPGVVCVGYQWIVCEHRPLLTFAANETVGAAKQ